MRQPGCKNIPSQRVNVFGEDFFPFVLPARHMGSAEPGAWWGFTPPALPRHRDKSAALMERELTWKTKASMEELLSPASAPEGRWEHYPILAWSYALDVGNSGQAGWAHGCACFERGRIRP